jgi:hypothetical protein
MITVGIISALGLLFLALKIGGRKTIGMDVLVDIAITITLLVVFYGTYSGTVAAMVGGLSASIILFIMKKNMKHEVLKGSLKERSLKWQIIDPKKSK